MLTTSDPSGSAPGGDFSRLTLQRYSSPSTGIVFHAPEAWEETADEETFQLLDPQTQALFTASGFDNPGRSARQWADSRYAAVADGMPFLRMVAGAHNIQGADWGDRVQGIVAEYRGVFPDNTEESHYLLACLRTGQAVATLSIRAPAPVFAANEALYRWLLLNQLDLCDVSAARREHDAAMQRWLRHNRPAPEAAAPAPPAPAHPAADPDPALPLQISQPALGRKLMLCALALSIVLLAVKGWMPGVAVALCNVAAMCLAIAGLTQVADSLALSIRARIAVLLLLLVPLVNLLAMAALCVQTSRHLRDAGGPA